MEQLLKLHHPSSLAMLSFKLFAEWTRSSAKLTPTTPTVRTRAGGVPAVRRGCGKMHESHMKGTLHTFDTVRTIHTESHVDRRQYIIALAPHTLEPRWDLF